MEGKLSGSFFFLSSAVSRLMMDVCVPTLLSYSTSFDLTQTWGWRSPAALCTPGEVTVSLNNIFLECQEVTSSFAPCHPLGITRMLVRVGVTGGVFPAVSGCPCTIYTCCVRQTFTYIGIIAHANSQQRQHCLWRQVGRLVCTMPAQDLLHPPSIEES